MLRNIRQQHPCFIVGVIEYDPSIAIDIAGHPVRVIPIPVSIGEQDGEVFLTGRDDRVRFAAQILVVVSSNPFQASPQWCADCLLLVIDIGLDQAGVM